jgi:NADH-quinone oxidoreductase subunit N
MTPWLFHASDYRMIYPEIVLSLFGLAILAFDFLLDHSTRYLNAVAALVALGLAGAQLGVFGAFLHSGSYQEAFAGVLRMDAFSVSLQLIIVVSTALVVLLSARYLEIEKANYGEYYALLLFTAVGMMLMAAGTDLIVLFLSLELMAFCEYILTGFLRGARTSNEAAIKFFLLGAFSSGLLLYGFSLLYGLSGSTRLSAVARFVAHRPLGDPLSWMAMITVLAGLFFKLAAVPFHQWTPDAYEGAPTTITAFISVAPKVASFAIFLRILLAAIWPMRAEWQPLVIAVAVATMTIGNLAAITQSNIKRFFGYSTISHVGYLLLGVVAAADGNGEGLAAILIYLLVYAFMNLGAFAVVVVMRRKDLAGDSIRDFTGLITRSPGLAILMAVFLLSLAGIPPTAGFIGKYYIFLSLIQTGHYYLAVLAITYSVIGLYYYMRIVSVMFMHEASESVEFGQPVDLAPINVPLGLGVALAVTVALTLVIGIFPEPFIQVAHQAIRPFFS